MSLRCAVLAMFLQWRIGSAQTREVTLISSITYLDGRSPALKLELRNERRTPAIVLTGVMTDHSYPSTNFTFALLLADGRNVTLKRQDKPG